MRLLLGLLSGCVLAGGLVGCGVKKSGPLGLDFVGTTRYTTGNRTVGPADTLATNLYALRSGNSSTVIHFTAIVAYTPQRAPFAYPSLLSQFVNNVPADAPVTFLDSTITGSDFLYSPVFGARTTAGTERWTFTATDRDGNTSSRGFVLAVRPTDSAKVYHDYTLRLRVPATGVGARRFVDLKSGLALPAYSVVGNGSLAAAPATDLQKLTDLIVLPDGLRLVSPDSAARYVPLNSGRWPLANRSSTRFRLTTLGATDFTGLQDTTAIINQFTGTGRAYLPSLALNQVYAFRATNPLSTRPVYGVLLVRSVPNGTSTVGLQLEVRLAKQPLRR